MFCRHTFIWRRQITQKFKKHFEVLEKKSHPSHCWHSGSSHLTPACSTCTQYLHCKIAHRHEISVYIFRIKV